MRTIHHLLSVLFIACFILTGCPSGNNVPAPKKEIHWAWRKSFSETNVEIGKFTMAKSGSKILFSAREKSAVKPMGDVIIGVDSSSKVLRDWRVPGKLAGLITDGNGNRLLVQLGDGTLLSYENWTFSRQPISITGAEPGAAFAPGGDFIVAHRKRGDKKEFQMITTQGALAAVLTSTAGAGAVPFVPFLNVRDVLLLSTDGALSLFREGKQAWSAPPIKTVSRAPLVASSYWQGDFILVAEGGDEGRIRLINGMGKTLASSAVPGRVVSVDCASTGTGFATLSRGPRGQLLTFFSKEGAVLWRHRVKDAADADSSVFVTANGAVVVAGFEEKNTWTLRAWNYEGAPLWTAPIEGGLADFRVAESGTKIAALTRDKRLVFFDTAPALKQEKSK